MSKTKNTFNYHCSTQSIRYNNCFYIGSVLLLTTIIGYTYLYPFVKEKLLKKQMINQELNN